MRNPGLIKAYDAPTSIEPFRIVKYGAAEGQAEQAAGAGEALFGVCDDLGGVEGARADVVETGVCEVEYGAAVTRGDLLTADAQGRAVPAAPASGATARIIGEAKIDGAAGDIGSLKIMLSQVTG
jgi:hypothetical protein